MKKITAILLVLAVALASVFAAVEIDGRGATEGQKVTVTGPSNVTIQYEVTNKFAPAFTIVVGEELASFDDDGQVVIDDNEDIIALGEIVFKLVDKTYSNSDAREGFLKNGIMVSFSYPESWKKGNEDKLAISVKSALAPLTLSKTASAHYDSTTVSGTTMSLVYNPGVQKLADAPVDLATFTLSWADSASLDAGLYSATVGIGYTAL